MADRNFSTKVIVTESGSTDALVANAVDGDGLKGIVTGTGAAVHGVVSSSSGSGATAGVFEQNNTSNSSFAVFVQQFGNSPAINAVNQNSGSSASAIKGSANNSDAILGIITGSGTAIHGVVNGPYTGAAGNFEQNSSASSANAVSISNAGSGKALNITNSTTSVSNAVEANNSNSANAGIAIKGISNSSSGTGVYGSNLSTGYAGQFDNKIKVSGNIETIDGKGVIFPNSSTGFPTGTAGQLYYHPTFKALFIYDGSAWVQQTTPSVSAFPSSPATNLVVRRSDRGGLEYQYDGTRWLTTQLSQTNFIPRGSLPFAQGIVVLDNSIPHHNLGGGIYYVRAEGYFVPNTGQSTTNFYTLNVKTVNTTPTTNTLTTTADTKTFTSASGTYEISMDLNQAITDTTIFWTYFQFAPTNNPGSFFSAMVLSYRLIG